MNKGKQASTEPMHCDHECVCRFYGLHIDLPDPCKANQKGHSKCENDTRAHDPVAQQAPTITLPKDMTNLQCIDEGLEGLSDYFNAALDGGESKAALRRMWDQQMGIMFALLKNYQNEPILSGVKNALAEYQAYEKGFSDDKKEHGAALIAQEREKGERERKQKNPKGSPDGWCMPRCDFFGDCDAADVRSCKRDARKNARDSAIAAQAREDVLNEVEQALESDECPVKKCEGGNCVPCIIRSLRSEVGK